MFGGERQSSVAVATTEASDLFGGARVSPEECVTIATVLLIWPVSDLLFLSSPDWSASLQPEEQKVGDAPVLPLTPPSSRLVFKLSLFVNKTYFLSPELRILFCFENDGRTGVLCLKGHLKTS